MKNHWLKKHEEAQVPECEFPSYDLEQILLEDAEWNTVSVVVDAGRQETYVNGELKDVKMFSSGLTEEEIQELYYPGYPQQTIDPIREIIEEEDRRFLQAVWDAIHTEDVAT